MCSRMFVPSSLPLKIEDMETTQGLLKGEKKDFLTIKKVP